MATRTTIKVDSNRPTYASDFIESDTDEVVFLELRDLAGHH